MQVSSHKPYGVAIAVVLLLTGALNLAYALAAGPHRPADAMQGVGLLLLGAGGALTSSQCTQQRLAATGRALVPILLIAFSIAACVLSVVLRVL